MSTNSPIKSSSVARNTVTPRSPSQPESQAQYRERHQNQPDPLRIAVIGAGPVGIEAALYAQRLGLKVMVFEREPEIAPDVRAWAHVSMFTPWADNRTPLGELALRERSSEKRHAPALPSQAVFPTGGEFLTQYLEPLAGVLGESLHRDTRIIGVGRSFLFPDDFEDAPKRRESRRFRLLTRSPVEERLFTADYVLDATGVSHSPNWLGAGGLPALGEMGGARHISYGIPDALGRDRIRFLGKRTLLIGDGPSAATSALMLAEVIGMDPPGTFVWATKERTDLPLSVTADDPLPRRDLLFKKANLLIAGAHPGLEHLPLTQVEAVQHSLSTGRFQATLQIDRVTKRLAFDSVVANVGSRRDAQTFERALQTSEPGFFLIGAKAAARSGQEFFLKTARGQIRDVFQQIMDDPALDLYARAEAALAGQARLAADEEMILRAA